jgi:hypothetical protein
VPECELRLLIIAHVIYNSSTLTMTFRITMMLASALSVAPLSAFATLGGDASTVAADQSHLTAQSSVILAPQAHAQQLAVGSAPAPYTTQQLVQPDGTQIREYLFNGMVFGIAWQGPTPPDLRQLLGIYFSDYSSAAAAAAQKGGSHTPIAVALPDVTVSTSADLTTFHGQAFVPSLAPAGVSELDIR